MSLDIQMNELHYYVDLLRMRDSEQRSTEQSEYCMSALHNVIRTMKSARHDKVCGENFTDLAWGSIPLNGIHFSMRGDYPCDFSRSKLNEWNFRSGHSSGVTSIVCSRDGRTVYSASYDNTVIVWDIQKGLMLNKMSTSEEEDGYFSNSIHSMALSSDERYIITGSYDGIARIWDLETQETVRLLEGHTQPINSVAFSNNGKYCMTGSSDSTARIWDLETGKCIQILNAGRFIGERSVRVISLNDKNNGYSQKNYFFSVTFSPDGRYYLTGSESKAATIWDAATGLPIRKLEGHNGKILTVAFSKDGRYCLTGSTDTMVKLWETETGRCLLTMLGHTDEVLSVAFSQDMKYCLSGSSDNIARIWSIDTGKCVRELKGHKGHLYSAVYTPDGKNCITGSQDKTIRVWDSETGACVLVMGENTNRITSFNFSADLKHYIVGMEDGVAKLHETESGKCLALLEGHYKKIDSVYISNDSKYCLTGCIFDNSVKLWDFNTGKCLNIIPCLNDLEGYGFSVSCISFSPDGKYCLSASWWSNQINLWETETGKCLYSLDDHTGNVTYAVFSSNGKYFITCSRDKTARLWDRETGTCLQIFGNHPHYVFAAAFLPDAQCAMTLSGTVLKLWNLKNGNCQWTNKVGAQITFDDIALSSDGHKAFVFSNQPAFNIAKVLATEDGSQVCSLKSPSFYHIWCPPYCISMYPDGQTSYKIFQFGFFSDHPNQIYCLIDTLHVVRDLHIWKCKFHEVNADQLSAKIIYQYGGGIE